MLCLHGAARRSSLLFLDFLAPSLVTRARCAHAKRPAPLQPDDHTLRTLKRQVTKPIKVSPPQVDVFNRSLAQLRQAIQRGDPNAAIASWGRLEQQKQLHFLTPNVLTDISLLFANSFSTGTVNPAHLKTADDIAITAAASYSARALAARVLSLLKQNQPEAVIDLYQRLVLASGPEEVWDGPNTAKDAAQPPTSSLAVDEATPRPQHAPGRADVLLAVVAAHALLDSFQGALNTFLQTSIRVNYSTIQPFLRYFNHDPAFIDKVQQYVDRLNVIRLVSRPSSLANQIKNLSESPSTTQLEKLYQSVISGLSGPDAYLAPDLAQVTTERLATMTEVVWTSFSVAFLKCRRRDLASRVQAHMQEFGVKPGVSMYTSLIDAYDALRLVDDALQTWNTMVAHGITPDALTYRAMISVFFNACRPEEALKTHRMFQEKAMSHCSADQALSVYNTVLHGLLSLDRNEQANTLLREMEKDGPKPDLVSYNTFLAYYARRVDFKALAGVVNQMASQSVLGDVFSFSTILSALLKVGREDATDIIFNIMRKQGIKPNVATYSAIIDHQMRERDEKNFEAALQLLQQMEQDPSIQPNEVTYTSILAGLFRGRWLPVETARQWRSDILGRMKKRGIELNFMTYHILIKASLRYPHREGIEEALSYYREMRRRKIPYVHTTWYTLLEGLCRRREWAVADEIIKDMYMTGMVPAGGLLKLVQKIRRREGGQGDGALI